MAEELRQHDSTSKLKTGEPVKISFRCKNHRDITWTLGQLSVIDYQPEASEFEEFSKLRAACFETTIGILNVTELSRVGIRMTYAKDFPSKEAAALRFLDAGIVVIPEGSNSTLKPRTLSPNMVYVEKAKNSGTI